MVESDHNHLETKDESLARLQRNARSLPRGFVITILGRTKKNVQGVIDAKGFHPKGD